MLPFLPMRRKLGWMAILCDDGGLALAHVVQAREGRPEVTRLAAFALETGEVDGLRRLRAAHELGAYACTTLMGRGEYNVTQLDAPPVPPEERREALRWALREMVSYPLESACIEVLDIFGLPAGRPPAVLVVSAAEQAVRARVAPFEAAKITLAALDIPELAQRNVAALLEDENRGLAFLSIDEAGMMLTLTFHGELIAVRRGDINTRELAGSDDDQRARVKERLALELQRSLDNFDRQYSHITISKVVLSSYPRVENLAAELGEATYVPVHEMDLAAVIDFPALPELRDVECQAKNLLLIGAALRAHGAQGVAA